MIWIKLCIPLINSLSELAKFEFWWESILWVRVIIIGLIRIIKVGRALGWVCQLYGFRAWTVSSWIQTWLDMWARLLYGLYVWRDVGWAAVRRACPLGVDILREMGWAVTLGFWLITVWHGSRSCIDNLVILFQLFELIPRRHLDF